VDPSTTVTQNATRDQRLQVQQTARDQVQTLIGWWVTRMAAAEHQFTEKLIFFWHGHWATSVQKVKSAQMMQRQLDTFRQYGQGDFGVFTKAMLRDPALIFWLDGQTNVRQAPNENLARELMELFTLGVGNYTEDDVRAGAKALTGWAIDRTSVTARFVANRHDPGTKTILGTTAAFDTDSYADLLMSQPANASFLAARTWFRFGSGEPIPPGTADRLAAAYKPKRDVTALMRALFTDPEFAGTSGALVKQPVEWLVGAARQLGLRPAALTDAQRKQFVSALDGLGQVPLEPPSVGGWPADAAWLTTSSLQVRLRVAATLAGVASQAMVDTLSGSTDAKLAALARLLVVDAWTDRTKAALVAAAADPRRLLTVGLASPEYTVS
jgi:uncharacterized protein (DUF1800 family)